jgi:GNAT superfamily N-acetyltransferase
MRFWLGITASKTWLAAPVHAGSYRGKSGPHDNIWRGAGRLRRGRINRCGLDGGDLKVLLMYRIREVDGNEEEIADTLADLHRLTFFDAASMPEFDWGYWWLAYHEGIPVAFAGVVPSTHAYNAGYFCRVGVLKKHCGNRLQLRLMRALELRARYNGWSCIVSDSTGNLASANNFIRAGYRLYQPQDPWVWPSTLYWRKSIT